MITQRIAAIIFGSSQVNVTIIGIEEIPIISIVPACANGVIQCYSALAGTTGRNHRIELKGLHKKIRFAVCSLHLANSPFL